MQYLLIGILLLLVSACDSNNNNQTLSTDPQNQVSLSPPPRIQNIRAIDSNALFAEIVVSYNISTDAGTEQTVTSTQTAIRQGQSNNWLTSIDVPGNTEFSLNIIWYDTVDAPQRLDLAELSRTLQSGLSDTTIALSFLFSDYDSSAFDFDGDSISNLEERENGTDPLVADSVPPVNPAIVEPTADADQDGIINSIDNCLTTPNSTQLNTDGDVQGDACDDDDDNDLSPDTLDCAPLDPTVFPGATEIEDGKDNDCDGVIDGGNPDSDSDGDGIVDTADNCPTVANGNQQNFDADALGDACDPDDDNDSFADTNDCDPLNESIFPGAVEVPGDGIDNNCDGEIDETTTLVDSDGDTIADNIDNCPSIANTDQANFDQDEQGDVCDTDDDNDGSPDDADCAPNDPQSFPGAIEVVDNVDNNCDGIVDNVTAQPTGLISAVSIGDNKGEFFAGSPPQAVGAITLNPLAEPGSDPVTVISGGSSEIPISADKPFSSVYILTDRDGYFLIMLPSETTAATLIVTYTTDQIEQESGQLFVSVEAPTGDVSQSQLLQLTTLQVGTGELQVSVSWDTRTDVDLILQEPNGELIFFNRPRSESGGMLDLDSNPNCLIDGINNENITYENANPPTGEYIVYVIYFNSCNDNQNTNYVLTTRVDGVVNTVSGVFTPNDVNEGTLQPTDEVTRFIYPAIPR